MALVFGGAIHGCRPAQRCRSAAYRFRSCLARQNPYGIVEVFAIEVAGSKIHAGGFNIISYNGSRDKKMTRSVGGGDRCPCVSESEREPASFRSGGSFFNVTEA